MKINFIIKCKKQNKNYRGPCLRKDLELVSNKTKSHDYHTKHHFKPFYLKSCEFIWLIYCIYPLP